MITTFKLFENYFTTKKLSLVKISDNEYRVGGNIKYRLRKADNTVTEEFYDCDKSFLNREEGSDWTKKEFDQFTMFGMPTFYVWDDDQWDYFVGGSLIRGLLASMPERSSSSSSVVLELTALYESDIIDKSIIVGIHSGKIQQSNEIYDNITFIIDDYGYSNKIEVEVPIDKFLDMDLSLFSKQDLQGYVNTGYLPKYVLSTSKLNEKQKENILKRISYQKELREQRRRW
jgi:hypothetical protein